MAPTEKPKTEGAQTPAPVKNKVGRPRNYDLGNGVMRFSRTRTYHKKSIYKFVGKKVPPTKKPVKPAFIVKPIGGEKNGKERKVALKKPPKFYPTQDKIKKRPSKQLFKNHVRRLRRSLKPGTVVILLAGAHKGKRAIFLKQLQSGLLLVTGPFKINGCPLRRISQRYVIATQTRVDLKEVKLPEKLNDAYFRRVKPKKSKKEEGDIFQTKKARYQLKDERKTDQKEVDAQIFAAIRKHPDKKIMLAYLSAMFGLRSSQFPHRMKF